MNTKYLEELNDAQNAAVIHTEGPVMIIAGAGSGKTRVLTYRIAHLLCMNVDAFHILALTFTNKAAKEMRNRIERIAGNEARNLWMGTFHAVFAKILRIEAERLLFPVNFTIYDTDDSRSLMKSIIREQALDDKLYKPEVILNRISAAKNNLYSWQDYQNNAQFIADDYASGKPKIAELFELYVKRCRRNSAMDFDDLLFNMYDLINRFPEALHKYQHKFKYILVDEFQDTNFVQYSILKKLAAAFENICVVGDDAQSIYAFRGANIRNILTFEKDYPDLKVFKLEQNYRSTKTIVNAANSLIEKNKTRLKKEVWTHNETGRKISVLRALSDNEEGMMVANSIFETRVNHQWHNHDFAILYRTNAQSRSMEEALRKMNIPYRIYGGLSFYKRKEIKDILAYFRLAINPDDEEALKRVINVPARGIGKTTLDRLVVTGAEQDRSAWSLITDSSNPCGVNSSTLQRLSDFALMIQGFSLKLKTESAYDLATYICTSSGLLRELYHDKTPEGLSRYENVQELLNGIREFVETGRSITPQGDPGINQDEGQVRTLEMYMQDIALLTDADEGDEKNKDTVSLMTVHAAKGLEFPAVFVVGLEENLFPSQLSLNDREDLEEERRLFYVAITRAEKLLTLSWATSRYRWGNLINCEPSRFLEEIDPEFLEEVSPRHPHSGNPVLEDHPAERWESRKYDRGRGNGSSRPIGTTQSVLKKVNTPEVRNFTGDDTSHIQPGMQVEHEKFGKGKVLLVEGNASDRKATICFNGFGNKQILLKYARLKML
ncbi:MAG: UvrD-helicase domain-containing protein [Bacteroidia bacterium]|nr:UvrD-helicase domain-containing protein [Bacteroidia bacterium]